MTINHFIYIYRILSRSYFHLPVLFLFFLTTGLKLANIELLLTVYPIAIFLVSLIKHKWTRSPFFFIFIATVLNILGYVIIIYNVSFIYLFFAQFILGCSYALSAGEESNMLFSSVLSLKEQKTIQQNSNSMMFIALLVAGVIGGIIYTINPYVNFYLSIIMNILILISLFLLRKESVVFSQLIIPKVIAIENSKASIYDFLYYGMTRGIVLALFVGFIPYLLSKLSIEPVLFALMICSYTLMGYLSSYFFNKINISYYYLTIISIILILIGTMLLFMIPNKSGIMFTLIFYGLGVGLVRPLTLSRIRNSFDLIKLERCFSLINILTLFILCRFLS